jgi:hypothetical protein
MGGGCCLEKDLRAKILNEENKIDMIENKFKELEYINKELILRKNENNENSEKDYLTYIIKIPELIDFIREEIQLFPLNENQDNINKNEYLNKLNKIENDIITQINEKIIKINEKSNNLLNEKNNINEKIELCQQNKIKSINFINNINNEDFKNFINQKNPSKKEYLILKLIFLIVNPEDKNEIPGLIIKKDLEIMDNLCFNKEINIIKQQLIERLDDISWISSEFLKENKIFIKHPYNDLKEMEKVSELYKNFFGYFNSLINYKMLYERYKPLLKKSEEIKASVSNLLKIKEEIERIKNKMNVNTGVNINKCKVNIS